MSHRAKSRGYTKHSEPAPANPPEATLMAKNFQKFSFGFAFVDINEENVTKKNVTRYIPSVT